jgi:hypothetical protein
MQGASQSDTGLPRNCYCSARAPRSRLCRNPHPDAGARPGYPKQRQHNELRRETGLAVDALPGNQADGSKGRHREGEQHETGQQIRGDNCTAPHKPGHARWRYRFAPAPKMMGLGLGEISDLHRRTCQKIVDCLMPVTKEYQPSSDLMRTRATAFRKFTLPPRSSTTRML